MRILLTGCTGFVGKFVLHELLERLPSDSEIVCLLRGKKGQTAEARWASIKSSSLYTYSDLSKVSIKEGDLEHLDEISWPKENPDLILHCAANVKTLDTYENLYRDNVIGVDNICQAALNWSCKRVILISTCYVHPKGTVGKSELLTKGLPRSIFTTDYTYTKYLGENLAQTFSDRLQISLLRLSCVGAPYGWLDAHPTPEAMAHLGIVSLMLRGKIEHIRIPSTMNLSIIPVDITAKCIVDEVLEEPTDLIKVKQICPGPDSIWNLSMSKLCKTILRLSPNLNLKIYESSQEVFERELRTNLAMSIFNPWAVKTLMFHQEVNRFIDKFADGQVFETSVPAEYFRGVNEDSEELIYEQTCFYVARSNHQHLIEKGSPRTLIDIFWGQMPENKIESHYIFREPLRFESKEAAEQRFFDCFSSYRPCFSDPDTKAFHYDPKQGVSIGWTYEEAIRYKKPIQIELLGSYEGITGMKFIIHHSTGDGLSYMRYVLARLDSITTEHPKQTKPTSSIKPRSLSFIQELWCFIYYFALLVKLVFSPPLKKPELNKEKKTIEMTTTKIHKQEGKSFTTSLLKQTYPALRAALGRDTVVYCIPAAIEGLAQRGLSMPRNSFVPIILPWSPDGGDMQELLLNSKAVKAISSLLVNFVSFTDMTFIRDHFLDRIDVVFSSLLVSDTPLSSLKTTHFLSPTPSMIPFTICAGTVGPETHLTVASSIEGIPASKLMSQIIRP